MASRSRRDLVSTDERLRKIAGGGDHGTPERWQHSGRALEVTDRAGILAAQATEEHILDILGMYAAMPRRPPIGDGETRCASWGCV